MKRTTTGLVCLLVIFGLAVSVTPVNSPAHKTLAAIPDGSQPPVPPAGGGRFAWMPDGSQPPVPPAGGGQRFESSLAFRPGDRAGQK